MKVSSIIHKIEFGIILCCCSFPVFSNTDPIDGYLSSFSVKKGHDIGLYISTPSPTYNVQLYHLGAHQRLLQVIKSVPGSNYSTVGSAVNRWEGANWSNPLQIHISNDWPSGLYKVVAGTDYSSRVLNFSVKESNPGSKSKILLLDNATTNSAYNNWGGKSLYTFNSSSNIKAFKVSLLRPGQNISLRQQKEFISWAETMNIPIEHASMLDLHDNPLLLSHYDTVVLAGHSEYWSRSMRNSYDKFVKNGGNAVILSGNTMWWQVRLSGNQMVAYKNNATSDPQFGKNNSLVTTNWSSNIVNDPENSSTGVSWRNGGYVNSQGFLPASKGYGGYTVTDASNWVFKGTNLKNGDILGQKDTIVGYETDGALFDWVNGAPVVTGEDGTPLNFDILGYSPAETSRGSGNATMGIFSLPNGGSIFNASTVDWADGLWDLSKSSIADKSISQITYNILSRFSTSVVPAPVPLPNTIYLLISALLFIIKPTYVRAILMSHFPIIWFNPSRLCAMCSGSTVASFFSIRSTDNVRI